jgi:hypothetical protein
MKDCDVEVAISLREVLTVILALSLFLSMHLATAKLANEKEVILGLIYIFHFGKHGTVMIYIRDSGDSISIGDVRYPAMGAAEYSRFTYVAYLGSKSRFPIIGWVEWLVSQ